MKVVDGYDIMQKKFSIFQIGCTVLLILNGTGSLFLKKYQGLYIGEARQFRKWEFALQYLKNVRYYVGDYPKAIPNKIIVA